MRELRRYRKRTRQTHRWVPDVPRASANPKREAAMTTYPHPACMEPDGGDGPCRGYQALENENSILLAFIREVAAIDPLAGHGPGKYFVTADFIARARALAYP